jgi:hypothetical protein
MATTENVKVVKVPDGVVPLILAISLVVLAIIGIVMLVYLNNIQEKMEALLLNQQAYQQSIAEKGVVITGAPSVKVENPSSLTVEGSPSVTMGPVEKIEVPSVNSFEAKEVKEVKGVPVARARARDGRKARVAKVPADAHEWRTYTVKRCDTLWGISRRKFGSGIYGMAIARQNNIQDVRKLRPGTKLDIPPIQVAQQLMKEGQVAKTDPSGKVSFRTNPNEAPIQVNKTPREITTSLTDNPPQSKGGTWVAYGRERNVEDVPREWAKVPDSMLHLETQGAAGTSQDLFTPKDLRAARERSDDCLKEWALGRVPRLRDCSAKGESLTKADKDYRSDAGKQDLSFYVAAGMEDPGPLEKVSKLSNHDAMVTVSLQSNASGSQERVHVPISPLRGRVDYTGANATRVFF